MEKAKLIFQHKKGVVEGVYLNAGQTSPLVIIINGHNGFYNYGMFPYIQQKLFEKGISSYSFNFSHGGITGDGDFFEDLEKYERNCMRLETEDLLCVLQQRYTNFKNHKKVILFAHSLGGIPTIFGTQKALKEKIKIDGLILVSTVKTLNFWPPGVLQEWASAGVYFKRNNRTNQELPQGFEFLQEVLKSDENWNVKPAIQSIDIPIQIIHGIEDEAVPVEHAETIFSWIKNGNVNNALHIIPNASHTYNTKHPFEKPSNELEKLIELTTDWIYSR